MSDLDDRSATSDQDIAAVLEQSAWAESAVLVQSTTINGPRPTAWLPVLTRNFLASSTSSAAVAPAGLRPIGRGSGRTIRKRPAIGHGGNKRRPTALYLAALNTVGLHPVVRR
jgi:hypothetical protein